MRKIIKKIKRIVFRILYGTCTLIFKLKSKRVLFFSDVREDLGGNLEYMYNYIDDKEYEKITVLKRNRKTQRGLKEKIKVFYYLSTSKYILIDDLSVFISIMKPRKGQKICQVWHASGAFKKFGFSRPDKKNVAEWAHHKNYTNVSVSSSSIIDCYAEGFGMMNKYIKPLGTPRTDMFFDKELMKTKKEQFYEKYPELRDKQIILFGPTYRGTSLPKATYNYDAINFDKLYKSLYEKGYVFAFKWHPVIYDIIGDNLISQLKNYNGFFYDFSSYRDINDLLLVADVLITDYSSVIFDYALLDKPVIYYAYDLYTYLTERGLYFDLLEYVYGPIAMDTEELVQAIINKGDYDKERKEFIEKFMDGCDGNSTKKVYEWVFEDKLNVGRNVANKETEEEYAK